MKALSIKQPWSWLICRGIKDVENRTWHIHMPPLLNYPATPRRIYVHTGLSRSEMTKPILAKILKLLTGRQASEFMLAYDRLTFGAIIGEVDIVGCTGKSDSPWFTGPYALMLANAVLYEKPIPCKGRLGFFDPSMLQVLNKRSAYEVLKVGNLTEHGDGTIDLQCWFFNFKRNEIHDPEAFQQECIRLAKLAGTYKRED